MFNTKDKRHSIVAQKVMEYTFNEVPPANEIVVGDKNEFSNYAEVVNAILEDNRWMNTNENFVIDWITNKAGEPISPCGSALDFGVHSFISSHAYFGRDLSDAVLPVSSKLFLMGD